MGMALAGPRGRLLALPCQLLSLQRAACTSARKLQHNPIVLTTAARHACVAAHANHACGTAALTAPAQLRQISTLHRTQRSRHSPWGVNSSASCRHTFAAATQQQQQQQQQQKQADATDPHTLDEQQDDHDGLTYDEDDVDFDSDDDVDFDGLEDDDSSLDLVDEVSEGGVVDVSGASINTGQVDWGEVGLTITRRILERQPDLQLFALHAVAACRRLVIALDKPADRFGSPSTEDLDTFVRGFNSAFEAALGEELASDIAVEVSSPGAERAVRVPRDLERFRELPMLVAYRTSAADSAAASEHERVFLLHEVDEAAAVTRWKLADVRVNREAQGKGRRLGKKKLQEVHEIMVDDLLRVNLHLDI